MTAFTNGWTLGGAGEKLPKLPMVIYGLEKKSLKSLSQPGINYVGRHLTFTKKKDWYYEWALYVPDGT